MSEIAQALESAKQSRETLKRNTKVIILAAFSLALISLNWTLISSALYGNAPLISWVWVVVAMMFWIATISFFVMVNPYAWIYAVVNIWGLALCLLLMPKDIYVVIGGVLFFLLSILFQRRIATEEKNQLNFSIRRTVSGSLIIATHAFLLLIAFNLYYNTSQDFKNNPQEFYQRIGEAAAKSIPFVSENLTPGANLDMTLDEYIESRSELPEELEAAPESEQDSFYRNYREQFLNQLGISAEGNETVAVVMSRLVNEKAKEVLGRFERFFPLIFTLVVIAVLRTFAFVFNWLTIFVTWVLFKILLAIKFFKLAKTTVEVQHLEV